jgi:arylsulfatase A-like enzyme
MATDAAIGRVLKAIDAAGVADNTLVLMTSDNGCASYIGVKELEAQGHFPSGPLRDYKASVYEGGHREPFIVRWPGVVKASSTCDQYIQQADVMATLAEIWQVKLPDSAGEDSFSLLPLLKGGQEAVRPHGVNTACNGIPSIRRGAWKLILAADAAAPEAAAAAAEGVNAVQLYNLAADLGETKNVAAENPAVVAELKALLEKLIVNGRSNPGPVQKNDVRVRRYPLAAGVPAKKAK